MICLDTNYLIRGASAAKARLATMNRDDFEPFVPHGLQLR